MITDIQDEEEHFNIAQERMDDDHHRHHWDGNGFTDVISTMRNESITKTSDGDKRIKPSTINVDFNDHIQEEDVNNDDFVPDLVFPSNHNDSNTTTPLDNVQASSSYDSTTSYIKVFCLNLHGPFQIIIICLIVALAGGSVVGVIPQLVTDRCAQYYYGLDDKVTCASFTSTSNPPPESCHEGSQKAQTISVISNVYGNITTFMTSALVGSLSDSYGRRPLISIGLFVALIYPLGFVIWSMDAKINPMLFNIVLSVMSSVMDWFPVALASLSDCIEETLRAATFGLLSAVFAFGYAVGPSLALLSNSVKNLLVTSFVAHLSVLFLTICFFPETIPSCYSAQQQDQHDESSNIVDQEQHIMTHFPAERHIYETQQRRILLQHNSTLTQQDRARRNAEQQQTSLQEPLLQFQPSDGDHWQRRQQGFSRSSPIVNYNTYHSFICRLLVCLCQPIVDMAILFRSYTLRILSLLAFLSGIVGGADGLLLLFYAQDQLHIRLSDIALMSIVRGIFGMILQGFLLKPLNEAIGERNLLIVSFTFGALHNLCIGLATSKLLFFIGVVLGSVLSMSFATVSAIKSMNVLVEEQGQIQGALYSLQSLSWAFGPLFLRSLATTSVAQSTGIPGIMFVMASLFYLLAVYLSYMLPPEKSDSRLIARQWRQHDFLDQTNRSSAD